jgi:hypothetical protein
MFRWVNAQLEINSTQFNRWNGKKKSSGKLMSSTVQPGYFLSLPYSHLFSTTWREIFPQTKNNLQCQILSQQYTIIRKIWRLSKLCRAQKPKDLSVRIDGRAPVTYRAVLVKFHKQNCVIFNVKEISQLFLTYWTLRFQFTVLS